MRFKFIALAVMFIISGLFASEFASFADNVHEYELDNGMKVLILPRHNSPTAAFVNYVDIGSINEFAGQSGAAHFLEHLAFKGTHTVGTTNYKKEAKAIEALDEAFMEWWNYSRTDSPDSSKLQKLRQEFKNRQEEALSYSVENEFGIIYSTNGGVGLNAYTSYDQTVYHVRLPSNKYELWCALESDRLKNPVFRQFYKEREVIQEERFMRIEDNPPSLLSEEFSGVFYKAFPYRDHIIGHWSEMSQIMRPDIQNFYDEYYHPANMTLAIVGDVDPDEMFDMIDDYFGNIPSKEPVSKLRTEEPEARTAKTVTLYDNARPFAMIGYQGPSASDEDFIPTYMMMSILGSGKTSRLWKRLVIEEQTALWAFSYARSSKYPSYLGIHVYPQMDIDSDSLIPIVDEEIQKLIDSPPSQEELDKVRSRYKADFIYDLSSNESMAIQLATHENVNGNWHKLFAKIEKMNGVTPEDIQEMAKKYLDTPYRTVGQLKPPLEQVSAEEVSK
ncbi:MAG: M16 family metallopeptidase [Candidatus Zixiibacteriota bacterium]